MQSNRFILMIAGVVLATSADASSLAYKHFYDDSYSEDDSSLQQPPPSEFREQDDFVYESEEEEEEEEELRVREPADYEPEGEFPRHVYDEVTSPTPPTHDPLDDGDSLYEDNLNFTSARRMAVLNIMDRLLIALGPTFGKTLPKPPTNNTFSTVPTPINITAEPCPYKYKRCSSQTSFPSCDIPHNTDPEVWAQRLNLYFNLSADFDKMDIINATLRLYKNNSIPLHYPKSLLIKAYAYTRSLTRRRSRMMIVAEKTVLSDYIGWITVPVDKIVRRWRKARNNHGLLITVTDADTIPWDASSIFVTMSCSSGNNSLVPLPFEVQTDEVGQRYPALNIRKGSLNDKFPGSSVSRGNPSPRPVIPTETVTRHIRSDDLEHYVYEDEYEFSQSPSQRQNNYPHSVGEHPANPHSSHLFATGGRRAHLPNSYPYGPGLIPEDSAHGHALRSGHEHTARSSTHDSSYSHGTPHHEMPGNYLITNEATTNRHTSNPHYMSSASHHRNPDHSLQGPKEHPIDSRTHTTEPITEDIIRSQASEEQLVYGDWVAPHRESIPTTEPSRPHRERDSGTTKERRHSRKHHHQRHGGTTAAL